MEEPSALSNIPAITQKPPKKQVHPVITVLLLILLLVFIGWQYVNIFGMPRFKKLRPVGEVVMEKVQETHGDITKVSKEDMAHLNDITMGNGEKYFKSYAKKLNEGNGKPPKP